MKKPCSLPSGSMTVKKFTLIFFFAMLITNRASNFKDLYNHSPGDNVNSKSYGKQRKLSLFSRTKTETTIRRMLFTTARAAAKLTMWAKLHAICKNASVNTKTSLNSPNLPDISVQNPVTHSLGKSSLLLIPGPYVASSKPYL